MEKHNAVMFVICMFIAMNGVAHSAPLQQEAPTKQASISGNVVSLPNFGSAAYYQRDDVRQAFTVYNQQKQQLINEARKAYRLKGYSKASDLYKAAYELRPSLPDAPIATGPIKTAHTMIEAAEWGESLALQGELDEAIQAYRHVIYQENTFSSVNESSELSPLTKMPYGVTRVDEAKLRYPNAKIINWVCNEPCVLARYALLLVEMRKYDEAIAVYNRALQYLGNSPYQNALNLGVLSATNFDKRRFIAAAHTIVADKTGSSIEIYYGYYEHKDIRSVWETELRTAIEVKPDYAPALVALADLVLKPGEKDSAETKQFARECLEKATTYARSSAQRELVAKKTEELRRKL